MHTLPKPLVLAILSFVTLLSACGGGTPFSYPQNVSISLSPTITSLAVGSTQQFTATVVNYTATPAFNVQATVAPVGSITQVGLYTAPAAPPTINYGGSAGPQVTVSAYVNYPSPTMFFGATATTSQTFIITAPTVTTGIIPTTATVPLGGIVKFQPYAVGNLNREYTLQVNGVTGGSMSAGTIVQDSLNAGLYTAPAVMPMTGKSVTITVISQADPTKTATATVTLQ